MWEKLRSYLVPRVVDQRWSKFNGRIEVDKSWGKYSLRVGGLTQSGEVIKLLWRKPLSRVAKRVGRVKRVLVLGLGGGTVVGQIQQYWPQAKIVGVEQDRVMVELGRQYLNLELRGVKVHIADAEAWVKRCRSRFEVIIVDLFVGKKVAGVVFTRRWWRNLRRILSSQGVIVVNLLDDKNLPVKLVTWRWRVTPLKNLVNRLLLVE